MYEKYLRTLVCPAPTFDRALRPKAGGWARHTSNKNHTRSRFRIETRTILILVTILR